MYSKVPVQQPPPNTEYVNVNGYVVTKSQYNQLINKINNYGSSFQSAPSALTGTVVNAVAPEIKATLQPVANILTYLQSETFWLNALGIAAGLVLVFIAIQFILQYETTNLAKGVVKTAVGKG